MESSPEDTSSYTSFEEDFNNEVEEIQEEFNTIDTSIARIKSLETSIINALAKEKTVVTQITPNPVEYPIATLFQAIECKT